MERTKVFIACAIGAGIGTMIALSLHQNIWWLGLIAGSLTGYLSYEFKTAIQAVNIAWKGAVKWRPNWEWWKIRLIFMGWFFLLSLQVVTVLVIVATPENGFFKIIEQAVPFICILVVMMNSVIITPICLCNSATSDNEVKKISSIIKLFNPISFLFYLIPKWIGLFIENFSMIAERFVSGYKAFRTFLKTAFILIHSEARLICSLDAGIGVCAGYFMGNVLVGALVGGIIGLLNYEIVSKRILKLIPKT
ncbi:MAG: hypothetical protein KAS02_02690 [Candidatus Pacebacteria bacterium]|nr:hypothetical protein [Candidatus Paceibacterota bacterium]